MERKTSNLVIILLVVIIVILGILCVLFATDTITFNFKNISNESNQQNENTVNNTDLENNNNDVLPNGSNNTEDETVYYQWYPEEDDSLGGTHSTDILELHSDGTAKLHGGKRNSSGWSYEGTYTETDNEITFKGYATAGNEELLGTDEYTKTFKKQGNNLIDELRNWTYSKVSKKEVKE